MASFTPSKKVASDFNNGNKLINGVDFTNASDMNNLVEGLLAVQEARAYHCIATFTGTGTSTLSSDSSIVATFTTFNKSNNTFAYLRNLVNNIADFYPASGFLKLDTSSGEQKLIVIGIYAYTSANLEVKCFNLTTMSYETVQLVIPNEIEETELIYY